MLARVADALYWIGRYLERAENLARLLLATEDLASEVRGLDEALAAEEWGALLAVYPGATLTQVPWATRRAAPPLALRYLHAFGTDPRNPYSVAFSLIRARDNVRSVREALTLEVFLSLNETYRDLPGPRPRAPHDLPAFRGVLASIHQGLLRTVGAIEHTLTRDERWLFLKLGESLERAYRTGAILHAKLPSLLAPGRGQDVELTYTRWRGLLRAVSSLENFRQAHGARLEPQTVVRFLLFDPSAPRSLRHGAGLVKGYIERISAPDEVIPATRVVGKLLARLAYDQEAVWAGGPGAFLERALADLAATHDALTTAYFRT
jgi:uncharacterized alpha-E superfamily protein